MSVYQLLIVGFDCQSLLLVVCGVSVRRLLFSSVDRRLVADSRVSGVIYWLTRISLEILIVGAQLCPYPCTNKHVSPAVISTLFCNKCSRIFLAHFGRHKDNNFIRA